MKFLDNIKNSEATAKLCRAASKYGYKLKKASPTIMVVAAGVLGIAATVSACKATLKAKDILDEHNEKVANIHEKAETAPTTDTGENPYTEEEMKNDITHTYVQTGLKLAKVYAPAVGMGIAAGSCMFGSHHIMTKRNASMTAAYIALDQAFGEYKNRVAERFGTQVQKELEQNVKTVGVESKKTNDDGSEELIKEYTDVAMKSDDPYSLIFDETVSSWQPDADLNRNFLYLMECQANRRLKMQGHLFLNEVLDMLGNHGGESLRTPVGQITGWIYDPNDPTKHNCVDFGVTKYAKDNDALNNFIDGFEPSVVIHFNCDGPIIDKI